MLDTSWRSAVMLSLVLPMMLVAFALMTRDVEALANRYLAAFMILFGVNLIPQVIGFSGFYQAFPWLTFAPFNNELWLGPLLLAHTHALLKLPVNKKAYWLYLPGVLQSSYYCIVFVAMPDYRDKWAFNDAVHQIYVLPLEFTAGVMLTVFCIWRSWQLINRYQQRLVYVQSSVDAFDPKWLRQAIVFFSALMLLWIVFESYNQLVGTMTYVDQFGFHIVFAVIVLWSGLQALSQIRETYPQVNWLDNVEQEQATTVDNKDTHLTELAGQIESQLKQRAWFRQSRLSINDIARELGTNETYVSRALNQHLKKNFNQLVNEARVEYAQACIKQAQGKSLLDIAFDSGFASKASFNRWFKQCTGLSPSAWQRSQAEATEAI